MKKNRIVNVQVNMANYNQNQLLIVMRRQNGLRNMYHVCVDSWVVGMLEKVQYNHPDQIRITTLLRFIPSIHMHVEKLPVAYR